MSPESASLNQFLEQQKKGNVPDIKTWDNLFFK